MSDVTAVKNLVSKYNSLKQEVAKVIERATGRLIITTFASSIGRISKIVEAAERCGKTVFLSGRSMEKNIAIARKLNYLKCKEKTIQRMTLPRLHTMTWGSTSDVTTFLS